MVREPNSDRRERSDRELFDRIAASYAKKDLVPSSRIARRAILKRAVLPLLSDGSRIGTVVDIGCGPGGQALHLAGDFDRYIGIDQSEAMIEAARALTHDLPEATFVHANVKSEDLPVDVADLVLLVGALHHMTDIGDVIQSLTRLAKPGADFVAIEPHRGNPIIQAMRWLRVRIDREYSGDQHFFIKPELERILTDGGLTDVELKYQSFLTQPFAQVILPDRRTGEDTVSNARTVVASLFIGRRMSSRPRSRPNAPSALVPKSEALASSATFARHFLPLQLRTQFTPMNSNVYSFDF